MDVGRIRGLVGGTVEAGRKDDRGSEKYGESARDAQLSSTPLSFPKPLLYPLKVAGNLSLDGFWPEIVST
jgi:hypothetical protein